MNFSRALIKRSIGLSFYREYAVKPSIALISEIRNKTEISIGKAKEALLATENNLEKALEWIAEDLKRTGATKAAKLAGRVATEGLIGVGTKNDIPGISRGALVELCCESDFVSRSTIFQQLVRMITTASLEIPESALEIKAGVSNIPIQLLSETRLAKNKLLVKDAIFEAISKFGENIQLRRAVTTRFTFSEKAASYTASAVHGGESGYGKIGGLVVFQVGNSSFIDSSLRLANQITKHVVGMNPLYLDASDACVKEKLVKLSPTEYKEFATSSVLMDQEFLFGKGSVQEHLDEFRKINGYPLTIKAFKRFVIGENVEEELQVSHPEDVRPVEKVTTY